ncbi:unnamed protein product [Acanthoscelides obtectus]|uniref:Thioredoxin domain-containing protein n=1 Tax=Acanthoscelides obtectus TaxID=200917 RepID=A0A9P0LHM8_ACAOB|nr:unnamed protein product [Acanthoscelides obtectus]CAH1993246.1 unnamed protein product [Acanthoscelides obtectus]CAK1661228.1 Thioredoxin-related transmembrane protein 2 homolog [Acanthoscelides obtectus]CAK1661229.1 Thioredoxin-related transmembrane protein 2 homolog [Acanthoscelides obtectus]
MSIKADIIHLFRPYYLYNILLSLSYIALKRIPGVCNYLFSTDNCEFDGRETEILFFLVIVVAIRTRKAGSMSMISYLSSSFVYTKVANLILWFNTDYRMGIIYGIIFILGTILFPEPTYAGPDRVTYFRGVQGLEEELERDKTVTWLVAFYTIWNPSCSTFAPIYAKLSNDFCLDTLKFGKVDIGRYPEAGKAYNVSDSSISKQLPTVLLFQDGKEVLRKPTLDSKGNVSKFIFSEENIKTAFGLTMLYDKCRSITKQKNKPHKE